MFRCRFPAGECARIEGENAVKPDGCRTRPQEIEAGGPARKTLKIAAGLTREWQG